MSDFHQGGSVATLHNLTHRPIEDLEAELCEFSKTRPMGLLLPCLFSELATDAMPNILAEIKKVPYLSQIVIGIDRSTESEFSEALKFFGELPQNHRLLWNDGPRLRALDQELAALDLAPREEGKGRNVWYCLGYMLASNQVEAIALHDCDIVTYDRSLLARLIYPMANPRFSYKFAKGYYPRMANGALKGRVTRLFITPLLHALDQVIGSGGQNTRAQASEYLRFLDTFRYPLAGEFSFRRDVIPDIRMPSDWGLEMGTLSEMHRNYAVNRLCQVDISDHYDHKHQDISSDDRTKGLSKMSLDICKLLYRKLAVMGVVFNTETFRSIKASYYRTSLDFIERYKNDAVINGLDLDIHAEEEAAELFAENIIEAGEIFLAKPMERPFIPSWSRVQAAVPDIFPRLLDAVEQDAKEFS